MTTKRFYLVLVGSVCLLLAGLVAGAYEVNQVVGNESKNLAKLKAQDAALSQQQDGLKLAKKGLADYAELEKIAHSVVPEDKSQAETVRQLSNIASNNNIKLASINFPASTLGNGVVAPSSPGVKAAPVPVANSKTSQLEPVLNIPGVYQLQITIISDPLQPTPYYRFINFLSDLENNRRTAQVNTISIQPSQGSPGYVSFTLTLNEYIKP